MQDIIAGVGKIRFDIEVDVVDQKGTLPLPFPGMDKSGSAVCEFFSKGHCKKGAVCSFRHLRGEKSVVCKHWLRGLCKKGDQCEFLHEYDMTRMPECYFYSKFNECSNKECPFLHIDPACKVKDCPWYDRGFCKHGPLCKHRHTRRVMCPQYLVGFCPEGAKCKFVHPKADLPVGIDPPKVAVSSTNQSSQTRSTNTTSFVLRQEFVFQKIPHFNLSGVGIVHCQQRHMQEASTSTQGSMKSFQLVTCYKCGEKGHYANKCGRGHSGFVPAH
ncbi:putative cleavage and polyadenylation specificity factor subunit 4-like protein isoform X1 [Erpetoichthys calabaricus]|uniref:Cleavage and polyadenylation specificity factor subunit 4 n=1 Tax=Erpetoichthys calabaricus TaxID=27687 RepID=A0A8C4T241_ERPCA|nr:putative cleavage and polyadenylation specificity factor subunit 4-like protein isoform X1 [Erpetoichthys calabaricus]